jgi:hypothetical protein
LTGVSYGGQTLTNLTGVAAASNGAQTEIWYKLLPASGSNNFTFTFSAAATSRTVAAFSYDNVLSVGQGIANFNASTVNSISLSPTPQTSTGFYIFNVVDTGTAGNWSNVNGTTSRQSHGASYPIWSEFEKASATTGVFTFSHAGGTGRPAAVGAEMLQWSSNTPTITPTRTPSPTMTPVYVTYVVTPQVDQTQVILGAGPATNGNFNIMTYNYGATSSYGHTATGGSTALNINYSVAFDPLTDPFHWQPIDNKGGFGLDQVYNFPTKTNTPTATPTFTVTPTASPTSTATPTSTITQTFTVSPTSTPTPRVPVPTNLQLGTLQPGNGVPLSWDDNDPRVSNWNLYFNGVQRAIIPRAQVISTSGRVSYFVSGLPLNASAALTLKALDGLGISDMSQAVTLTAAAAPFNYAAGAFSIHGVDTYTVPAAGHTVAFPFPLRVFTVEVCSTDAPATSWTVNVQGSLDGINFTDILPHGGTDCAVDSTHGSIYPVRFLRSNCTALSLGGATNIVVTIVGTKK